MSDKSPGAYIVNYDYSTLFSRVQNFISTGNNYRVSQKKPFWRGGRHPVMDFKTFDISSAGASNRFQGS